MTIKKQDIEIYEGEDKVVELTVEFTDISSDNFFIEFLTESIASSTATFTTGVNTITFNIPASATADRGQRKVKVQTTHVDGSNKTSVLSDGEMNILKRAV